MSECRRIKIRMNECDAYMKGRRNLIMRNMKTNRLRKEEKNKEKYKKVKKTMWRGCV